MKRVSVVASREGNVVLVKVGREGENERGKMKYEKREEKEGGTKGKEKVRRGEGLYGVME